MNCKLWLHTHKQLHMGDANAISDVLLRLCGYKLAGLLINYTQTLCFWYKRLYFGIRRRVGCFVTH